MATDLDDVRLQGKTGSSRPTTKMTRMTPKRTSHLAGISAVVSRRSIQLGDVALSVRNHNPNQSGGHEGLAEPVPCRKFSRAITCGPAA
jgi:hypothetical protein